MVRRSITSALRPLSGLRATAADSALPRCFSTTGVRGFSAVFAETENPELNKVFKEIQDTILLPAYLPSKQRNMIFDPKMKQHLQQNPIIIELDGLEHRFSTIDRFRDIPNSKKILDRALKLMETKDDWENLGTLLAGYHKAGIKLRQKHYAKIIRMAGQRGHIYTIIECAKQAQTTNLLLNQKEYLAQLLLRINEKITSSSRGTRETVQAAKWTELVLDMIQRPEHVRSHEKLHHSPTLRGLMLFTQASAVQVKQAAGQAVEKDLADLKETVELLITLWGGRHTQDLTRVHDIAELNAKSPLCESSGYNSALSNGSYVQVVAQNIKGLELAQELLGEVANPLQPVKDALEKHLSNFAQDPKASAWAEDYEKVVGRKPNWPAVQ